MIPFLENKKVWGFAYLKIEKLQEINFMLFDRYEIPIQAFVDFIDGKFIIFRSSSPQNYFKNMYSHFHQQFRGNTNNIISKTYIFFGKNKK